LPRDLALQCKSVDQPSAALVQDLKQRGLLDDTLVIWGGEFGRTVYCQGKLMNLKTAVDLGGRPQALESIEVATAAHFTNLVTTAVAVTACRHKTWAESESSTALFRMNGNYGRDHHPRCFSMWMAGGGIKPGMSMGETDEFSYNIVADPVHVHDIQATVLKCLGIDHERLTYKFQGRDFRLTDVAGNLVPTLIA
jgi:arylsulfatase A-like enzyme